MIFFSSTALSKTYLSPNATEKIKFPSDGKSVNLIHYQLQIKITISYEKYVSSKNSIFDMTLDEKRKQVHLLFHLIDLFATNKD